MKKNKNGLIRGMLFCIAALFAVLLISTGMDLLSVGHLAPQHLPGVPIMAMAGVVFADVPHDDLANNTPGLKTRILYWHTKNITSMPDVTQPDPATGTGALASLVTVTDNIVFAANYGPYEAYATAETLGIMSKLQGELDGKSFRNELKFKNPGQKASFLGLLTAIKNGDMGFAVIEMDGTVRLLGNPLYPAKLADGDTTTGDGATSFRGSQVTIYDNASHPAPIWNGQFDCSGTYTSTLQDELPDLFV